MFGRSPAKIVNNSILFQFSPSFLGREGIRGNLSDFQKSLGRLPDGIVTKKFTNMNLSLIGWLIAFWAFNAPGGDNGSGAADVANAAENVFNAAGYDNGELVIELDNIKEAKGTIWVGIYDSQENYLVKEKAIVQGFKVERTGSARFPFYDMPYGAYAVALFHDINDNGELDRNFFGIPTEPFAFSRPPRSKWRLPSFGEVSFQFRYNSQRLRVSLRNWYD